MRGFLLSRSAAERNADFLERLRLPEHSGGDPIEPVLVPEGDSPPPLAPELMASIRGAFFETDYVNPTIPRRLLGISRRAPNLQWMHLGHAGTDDPVFQELMDRGVVVTNSSGVTAEPIAQSAMTAILLLNRGFHLWADAQRRHAWERVDAYLPRDLRGQTLVIVGLGSIGGHLARFARAFGMHVIGVRRRSAGGEDGVDEWASPDRLGEVLPRADVLALTVPLTEQTRGLIDAAALARLPRGAVLVNVSRGQVVDEEAVIHALASGQLGGAYLDVFEVEPLPADSPLWDMPNVILSPHDAGRSAGNQARVDAVFREEVQRWVLGQPSERLVLER